MSGGAGRTTQTAELVFTSRNETGRDFRQIAADMDKARAAMDRQAVSSSVLFQRAAGGAAGLERRLTAATAAMGFGEVLRSSIGEAAAMDRRMTRLAQNAEQTKGTMGDMKKVLIDLANETGQSIESVIAGFETLVGQTGDYKTAKANIDLIARANQALGADMQDTAQTARVLDDTLNFKNAKSMERAFDMFAAGTRIGAFEAKDFAKNMPIIGQSMKQAGQEGEKGIAEMVAAMELIRRVSPDSERAVLAYRDVIDKAFQPEAQKKFQDAGVNLLGELQKTQRQGGSILATITSATDVALSNLARAANVSEDQKISLLPQLFGEVDSRRGAAGLVQFKDIFVASMREIMNSSGEMKKRFSEVNKDSASDLQKLSNKWEETKLAIGKSLIDIGVLRGMDEFGAKVDETLKDLDRLAKSIERIKQNPLRLLSEPVQYGIEEMHKEIERVSKLNLARAEKNRDKALFKAPLADREVGKQNAAPHEADAKAADERAAAAQKAGDAYRAQGAPISAAKEDENRARAQKDAEKARFKAQQALTARSATGDALRAEAEREEARAKRLRYQLKRGFNAERVFGNSEDDGPNPSDRFVNAAGNAMRNLGGNDLGPEPGTADPREIPSRPSDQRVMRPEVGVGAPPEDTIARIRREAEEVKRAQADIERAKRADETPRFDARMRDREDAEARAREQAGTRVMRPEVPAIAQPPAINRRPDHVPGGLVDPYAPPPSNGDARYQPSSFDAEDFRSMIRNSSYQPEGGTTDTGSATARGQQDQIRLTEQTNALLNRLIAQARFQRSNGIGEGEPGSSTAGGAGGGGGGAPGGVQMGGGGSGAGGAAGDREPGATPRAPFGGGRGADDQPVPDGPTADVPGALNPRLAGARKSLMDELDRDPSLRRDVIKTASMENRGSPQKMQAVIESMVNRSKMNGYTSLRQAIHSGFYGPVNRGGLSGGLSAKDQADGEAALAQVKGGSNAIGYRTDQGMLTDPGARRYMKEADHSGHQVVGGENFFYMGQKGREYARQQEAADRAAGIDPTARGNADIATPRSPFTPGSSGNVPRGDMGSPEGLRIKGAQATGGGGSERGVYSLARMAQGDLPGGVKHFAAFNDHYHAGTGSKHASGLAFDTSLNDPRQSGQAAEAMRDKLRAAGLSERDFKVIDEYTNPSGRATGGHIHTQFNNREAARRYHQFAEDLRKQEDARNSAEKAQQPTAAATPRSPFTPGSAGANPPSVGVPPKPSPEFGPRPVADAPEAAPAPAAAPAARSPSGLEAETDAIRKHREEAEKPIRLRYQSDGMGRNNTAESVGLRRGTDASLRHQRYNSYSDTGVA